MVACLLSAWEFERTCVGLGAGFPTNYSYMRIGGGWKTEMECVVLIV
jgi:hypothetical protein